jgi:hypothetical protein
MKNEHIKLAIINKLSGNSLVTVSPNFQESLKKKLVTVSPNFQESLGKKLITSLRKVSRRS